MPVVWEGAKGWEGTEPGSWLRRHRMPWSVVLSNEGSEKWGDRRGICYWGFCLSKRWLSTLGLCLPRDCWTMSTENKYFCLISCVCPSTLLFFFTKLPLSQAIFICFSPPEISAEGAAGWVARSQPWCWSYNTNCNDFIIFYVVSYI